MDADAIAPVTASVTRAIWPSGLNRQRHEPTFADMHISPRSSFLAGLLAVALNAPRSALYAQDPPPVRREFRAARDGPAVPVAPRAVVGVSHGPPGSRARAGLGSARLRRHRSTQARNRAARLVQPVPRSLCKAAQRGGTDARQSHRAVTRQAIRKLSLDGSG